MFFNVKKILRIVRRAKTKNKIKKRNKRHISCEMERKK